MFISKSEDKGVTGSGVVMSYLGSDPPGHSHVLTGTMFKSESKVRGVSGGGVTLVCHVWALCHPPTDDQSVCVLSQLLLFIMNR